MTTFFLTLLLALTGCVAEPPESDPSTTNSRPSGSKGDEVSATLRVAISIDEGGLAILDRWIPGAGEHALATAGDAPLTYRFETVWGFVLDAGVVADPRALRVEGDSEGLQTSAAGTAIFDVPNRDGFLVVEDANGDLLGEVRLEPTRVRPTAIAGPDDFLGQPEKLVDHGDRPGLVNILILPDGYTEAELPAFREEAAALARGLGEIEGFKDNWNAFNIYRQDVRSRESGIAEPNAPKDTAFELSFGDGTNRVRRCVMWEGGKAAITRGLLDLRRRVGADAIVILGNGTEHGGCARFNEQTLAMTRYGTITDRIHTLAHELGHALFLLNDEYVADTCNLARFKTGGVNVSSDLTALPWSDMLTTTQLPTPTTAAADVVGAFEGAGYCPTGAYRPQRTCRMRNHDYAFCAVCRRQITRTFALRSFVADETGGHFEGSGAPEFVTEGRLAPRTYWENPAIRTPFLPGTPVRIELEALEGEPTVQAAAPAYVVSGPETCLAGRKAWPPSESYGPSCDLQLTAATSLTLNFLNYTDTPARYRVRVRPVPGAPDGGMPDAGDLDGGVDSGTDSGTDAGTWAGLDRAGTLPRLGEFRVDTGLVPAGRYDFRITSGSGDPDLFVRTGLAPTLRTYDCKSDSPGTTETCSVTLSSPSVIHVLVQNSGPSGSFVLTGRASSSTWAGFDRSGTLTGNGTARFVTARLEAGRYELAITGGSGDPDLYVRRGAAPTTTVFDCKSDSPGTTETCTLTLSSPSTIEMLVHNSSRFGGSYMLRGRALP